MELILFDSVQSAYFSALDKFPYEQDKYLEIKPGVRVPTDDWVGYRYMAEVFFDDVDDKNNLVRMRRALAVHNQVRTEIGEGGKIDVDEVQRTLENILFEESLEETAEEKKAIIHGVEKNTGKNVEYMVEQSDGEDALYSKYELKKKYPDTWQQMIREYQSITVKSREAALSDSLYSSKLEDEVEKEVVKNNPEVRLEYRQEEEVHQGSTMMGGSDEKRFTERKKIHTEPESHGEAGLHKYENDLVPKPASVYAEHNGDVYRKRLSEPPSVGHRRSLMYSPHIGKVTPNTEIPAKRYRPSIEQQTMDTLFISPAQTDTAATAWNLLSKIMSNENRLIAALEEQKSRNAYLEKLVVEGGGGLVALNDFQTSKREAELTKEVENKEEEIQTLKSLLQKSSEEHEGCLQQLGGLEENLKQAREMIQSKEKECARSTAGMQHIKKKLKKLEKESMQNLAERNKRIEDLQIALTKKQEETMQLTDAMANADVALREKTIEYKSLEKLIANKEKRFKRELSNLGASQDKELKKLADTLLKVRVEKDREEEKMKDMEKNLRSQLKESKKKFQEAIDALARENRDLRARVRKPSHDNVDPTLIIDSAMQMQREARNTLDILKRGNSLEITSFYDNVEFDGPEENQEMEDTDKWLHPTRWRNCTIVGAKKTADDILYKCVNSNTNESAYISSKDMQKRQFCLLPMLQFIENKSLGTTSTDTTS